MVVTGCVGRAILLEKICEDVEVGEMGEEGEIVELDRLEVITVVDWLVT